MIVSRRPMARGEWVGIHEAAALVGVSPATLRRWSDAGDIDAFTTPGGHRRFSRSSIAGLISTERGGEPIADQLDRIRARLDRALRIGSHRLAAEAPWAAAFDDDDRADIALQGRRIVDGLVAALDERTTAEAARSSATTHAAVVCGELAARRGVALGALIAAGLHLDAIAVHEIAEAARRLDLDGSTTARWLDDVACTIDRLLGEAMRGHAAAHAVAPARDRPKGSDGTVRDGTFGRGPDRRRDAPR
jgi:excisionase family DNA binding protein